jgi:RNA polymerase sigma factor (sigma-70 family)
MSDRNVTHNFCIELFRTGDRDQFKNAYELFYEPIFMFVYNLVRSEQEAQDITIETFAKLWQLRANFENLTNIKAFLYVTSRNASLDHFRKLQRQRSIQKEVHYMLEPQFSHEVLKAEVITELYKRIENLPSTCRKIIKLMLVENMDTVQIAKKLGLSSQTVRNQKAIAVRKLKVMLLAELCLLLVVIFS